MPKPTPQHLTLVPQGAAMAPEPGDETLMALACAGDQRAFAQLVRRHEAGLRRLASLLVGDPERGRELVQDAWVQAWERRAHYRPQDRLRAWLAGIVRNLAARERRRQRVRAFFGLATPPAWATPASDDDGFTTIAAADRDRVLAAGLQRLPPKMREALALRFVEGLDYDTMAALIGVSASTLRSRVFHGLALLAPHVPEEVLR